MSALDVALGSMLVFGILGVYVVVFPPDFDVHLGAIAALASIPQVVMLPLMLIPIRLVGGKGLPGYLGWLLPSIVFFFSVMTEHAAVAAYSQISMVKMFGRMTFHPMGFTLGNWLLIGWPVLFAVGAVLWMRSGRPETPIVTGDDSQ